ncbi:hypothetical protein NUU61_010147 [Penicillium alfredii]|uniref:Aminoglycoside phosphotransferase domain-containing protein n=1 Tax=Penicillium alfredii TaxID=1506179 RepID=A0A9W9JU95_9EURO|nr:uncharacterized protein NUU61_010147 [Penicillium alfredii]KAJ5081883.1 hypothetical protein NUU61_010147 [Penicillium alfredii]
MTRLDTMLGCIPATSVHYTFHFHSPTGSIHTSEDDNDGATINSQPRTSSWPRANPDQERIIHSLFDRKVVRLNDSLVVKPGPNLRIHEVHNLGFIAKNTTSPVPKVHGIYWGNGKMTAFVMDYMPSKQLDEAWDSMSSGDYTGAVDRGKAMIGRTCSIECGPFDSERAFNEFLLEDLVGKAPDLLRHYAKHALMEGHDIVFTHGYFAPRNILVDESGRVTAILDWEYAGWYPEHWEYIKAMQRLVPMPGWPDYLSRILPPRYEQDIILLTMPSTLRQTALTFIDGFKSLSADSFLAVLAPTSIHKFAPSSISVPPDLDPNTFAHHVQNLRNVLSGFPVFPKEIFENEEKRQVTVWATSLAIFRDEVKDKALSDEEWAYRGEYIFIFTMDESREKIVNILEFVDSKGTERLRELMARARRKLENLEKQ